MTQILTKLTALSCALILIAGCKKPAAKETTCGATVYGYRVPASAVFDTVTTSYLGVVDPGTSAISTIGSFNTCAYTNQGAFSSSDNCFYNFKTYMGSETGTGILYKTDLSGAVTTLHGPADWHRNITYNKATHKLYCITGTATSPFVLTEINISGTTFTTTPAGTSVHPFFTGSAADDLTGNIYHVTGDTGTFYIEKFTPGSSTLTVVASGTGAWDILGLTYNKNDHMLYAIREAYTASAGANYHFIKIDPATGTTTTLSTLSFDVNREFYSACLNPCTDRYIISTVHQINSGTMPFPHFFVNQLNLTGTLVQNDSTADFIQGLYVNY
jgi:hypothetical protein